MLLTASAIAITSDTLFGGAKVYAEHKKKKEQPWTYALEKLKKRNRKGHLIRMNRPAVNGAVLSSYDKLYTKLFRQEDEPSLLDKLLARQQLEEITGQKYEMSPEEKRMQRNLAIASVNLGIAGVSLLYPPLIWLAVPGVVNNLIPFYQLAFQAFKEGRVSSYMLDTILEGITIPPEIAKALQDCHEQGETMVMVAFDEQLVGAIELQATIRPESKQITPHAGVRT